MTGTDSRGPSDTDLRLSRSGFAVEASTQRMLVAYFTLRALAQRRSAQQRLRRRASLPLVSGTPRLGPCVSHVGKFICFGLNYSDHAAETGMAVPAKPVDSMKATSSVCGPNDKVVIPKGSKKADWEVEIG